MCIYYINRDDLTYNGTEHIFPAALGGIAKLKKGLVSDQFNNNISALEQDFIRESYISFMRHTHGPGKRGNLSPEKATKSKILVVEVDRDRKYSLAYSRLQESIEIPHFYHDSVLSINYMALGTLDASKAQESLDTFHMHCTNPDKLRIRTILDNRMSKSVFMFGIKDDVEENYNAFFAKHPQSLFEITPGLIKGLVQIRNIPQRLERAEKMQLTLTQNYKIEEAYLRVFGKIAFNYLAHKAGLKFVCQAPFNAFRAWIAFGTGDHRQFANWQLQSEDPFKKNGFVIPELAHYVIIGTQDGNIFGRVSLYGMSLELLIGTNYPEKIHLEGLICDWRNRNEVHLNEYLANSGQLE